MSELPGKFEKEQNTDERKIKNQYNSIDFLTNVQRLAVIKSTCQGIYHYGYDNKYPTKIIEISKRSGSLETTKEVFSKFLAGRGFEGATAKDVKNDTAIVINEKGQTAFDLLKFCANQKANINIAIHVNYNQLGEAIEFNFVQYDFVRRKVNRENEKYNRYIITNIWHLENDIYNNYSMPVMQQFNRWINDKKVNLDFTALEVFEYNPDPVIVREQIEISGGIENYPGQLFYMKRTEDIYQRAIFDSVIDSAQFEAEANLFSLSNIQNGFAIGGIFKHFGSSDNTKEMQELKEKLRHGTGSINAGRIFTVAFQDNADGNIPDNLFEPITHANIDSLFEKQLNNAKESIKEKFNAPNALIGRDTTGNFATQKMQETFEFYNAMTQDYRIELEIELTKLFKNSVFANQIKLPIKIEPLKYEVENIDNNSNIMNNEETN